MMAGFTAPAPLAAAAITIAILVLAIGLPSLRDILRLRRVARQDAAARADTLRGRIRQGDLR